MKTTISIIFISLIVFCGCEKANIDYQFTPAPKLLISIQEKDHFDLSFRYDNLNRLIVINKVYYFVDDTLWEGEYLNYNSKNQLISKTYSEYTENFEYNRNGSLRSKALHFKSAKDGYEWEQVTQYKYSQGRIYTGTKYSSDGNEISHYTYNYDQKGNTTERTEYAGNNEMIMSQLKITYDDKINPGIISYSTVWGESNMDIVQGNNPTSFYYYNAIMSSFPPEYEITYEYDKDGLPLKEYRKRLSHPLGTSVYEYKYIEKSK